MSAGKSVAAEVGELCYAPNFLALIVDRAVDKAVAEAIALVTAQVQAEERQCAADALLDRLGDR
jgi:hypothetical protein